MSGAPLLVLRVDATPATGLGHAARCAAIAEAWVWRGGRVRVVGAVRAVARWFVAAGASVAPYVALMSGPPREADDPCDDVDDLRGGVVLADGYHLPEDRLDGPCPYHRLRDDDLRGAAAPLRSVVRTVRGGARRPGDGGSGQIVVAGGGVDATGLVPSVLAQILSSDARVALAEVVAVVGPFAYYRYGHLPTVVAPSAAEWAGMLVSRGMLCVTAAGTTLWELAYLGVPAVAVVTCENQRENARAAAAAGCAVVCDVEEVQGVVEALVADRARRRRMSDAGRALMGEGDGAERVVDRWWPA